MKLNKGAAFSRLARGVMTPLIFSTRLCKKLESPNPSHYYRASKQIGPDRSITCIWQRTSLTAKQRPDNPTWSANFQVELLVTLKWSLIGGLLFLQAARRQVAKLRTPRTPRSVRPPESSRSSNRAQNQALLRLQLLNLPRAEVSAPLQQGLAWSRS